MHFEDEVTVGASPAQVWAFLQDPHALGACIPGLETVEIIEPGRIFGGTARINFGSLELKFPARVEWVEQQRLQGGRLRALVEVAGYEIEGEGGLRLEEVPATAASPGGTHLSWEASATLPAALADNPLTAQMAQSVAGRFIKSFFECIQTRLKSV